MAGSDENTTLEKKARGAKSTKLSPSQVSLVRAIVDGDFADHVREVDSTFKGFGTVSGWVDGKVKGILNMPEIRSNADEDPKGFTKSISNMFRNHYNNVLKKSYRLGLSSTGDPSSQALPPVDDGFVKLLLPPLTGRHLYEAENKAALNEQRVAGGVGNYQHVLKVAWDGLDGDARSEWEQRARDEEGNIDQ
ncbi:hypothetical protein PENSPDRAFT_379656 [Peniophora sp. CONT]|nr:hypothetical protein PENSPDRAFT_379656 [Peniophora sp. CONT]